MNKKNNSKCSSRFIKPQRVEMELKMDLVRQVKEYAKQNSMSVDTVFVMALESYLKKSKNISLKFNQTQGFNKPL